MKYEGALKDLLDYAYQIGGFDRDMVAFALKEVRYLKDVVVKPRPGMTPQTDSIPALNPEGHRFFCELKSQPPHLAGALIHQLLKGATDGYDRGTGAPVHSSAGKPANQGGPGGTGNSLRATTPGEVIAAIQASQGAGKSLTMTEISVLLQSVDPCLTSAAQRAHAHAQVQAILRQQALRNRQMPIVPWATSTNAMQTMQMMQAMQNSPGAVPNPQPYRYPVKKLEIEGVRCGTLIGYRCWNILGPDKLGSTAVSAVWRPGEEMTGNPRKYEEGVHAYKSVAHVIQEFVGLRERQNGPPLVIGRVELMGEIWQHTLGYRAERAKIVGLDGVFPISPLSLSVLADLRKNFLPEQETRAQDE